MSCRLNKSASTTFDNISATDVAEFSWAKLLLDLLVVVAIVALTWFCCRGRIRRHGSLLRVRIKDLLFITALVSAGLAWFTREYRNGIREAAIVAQLNEEVCFVESVQILPDWIVELVGAEMSEPFRRAVCAHLGDSIIDWYASDGDADTLGNEEAERHASCREMVRQAKVLTSLPEIERLSLTNPPPNQAFLEQLARIRGVKCIHIEAPFFPFGGTSFNERLAQWLEWLDSVDDQEEFASIMLIAETLRQAFPEARIELY